VTRETTSSGEITILLARIREGDRASLSDLSAIALPELRRLAANCLHQKGPSQSWFPTDLVNELWVRLLRRERFEYQNRAHFLGAAAQLMRALVIDRARKRNAAKRPHGTGITLSDLVDSSLDFSEKNATELMALDDALEQLAILDARQARIVEMRYFVGFTVEETAEAMNLSPKTINREWAAARAWLHAELRGAGEQE
jgi:RNA polymerase sigma factor (TIGR02999 family)